MSVRQTAGDGPFTLAGSARLPGSATGRGLVCSGTGAAGRTGPTRPLRLAGRGADPLVAERADEMQSAAGLVEGAGRSRRRSGLAGSATGHSTQGPGWSRPSRIGCRGRVSPDPGRACRSALVMSSGTTIAMSGLRSAMPRWCRVVTVKSRAVRTDPGSAPSARVAIRGRHAQRARRDPVMAATCRSPGRPSPRPASASGSRRCPPGMTGALPSPPGRCHRACRIGVCRFCDHQVLAGLTGLTRCRLAAAASSPGSDRIEDRTAGMGGTDRVSGVSAAGHGLIGRGIVVPFQLRPAGRGVAAGSAAGVTAAARRDWDPGGPGDGRVPVARHDRAGGPVAGVVVLASGAG